MGLRLHEEKSRMARVSGQARIVSASAWAWEEREKSCLEMKERIG